MELKAIPTTLTELPDVLRVIEGTLNLDTQEDSTALSVLAGLKYYLSLEFARQQPALALLYDLDFQVTGVRPGSRHIDFKIWVRLKKRVRTALVAVGKEIKKAGVVACIATALAIPGAINETEKLLQRLPEPTQQRLQLDVPQCSPSLTFNEIRVPDERDATTTSMPPGLPATSTAPPARRARSPNSPSSTRNPGRGSATTSPRRAAAAS